MRVVLQTIMGMASTWARLFAVLLGLSAMAIAGGPSADARIYMKPRKIEVANQLVSVTSDALNVRRGPSTSNAIVTQLANGMVLEVIDRVDLADYAWFKVKVPDGAELGFVRGDTVTPIEMPTLEPEEEIIVCEACPEMIDIAAGNFRIGAKPGDAPSAESPARPVAIASPFRISRTEVTVGQFNAFLTETGANEDAVRGCYIYSGSLQFNKDASFRRMPEPTADNHPVVCVSWREAEAFVKWLSDSSGRDFQLPSEAQWEFVARAGNENNFVINIFEPCTDANFADLDHLMRFQGNTVGRLCQDGAPLLSIVAQYEPNAYGVNDMIGNVSEWTQDCWNDSHLGVPTNGAPRLVGDCDRKVARGAAWIDDRTALRVTSRKPFSISDRYATVGFRVVEFLPTSEDDQANLSTGSN